MALSARAADYDYLVVRSSVGTVTALSISQLKITFADGQLVAVNSETTQTFNLTSLSKMYFSQAVPTGVERQQLVDDDAAVEVIALSGVSMGRFERLDEARQRLQSGVYVVKQNGKTFKIAVK